MTTVPSEGALRSQNRRDALRNPWVQLLLVVGVAGGVILGASTGGIDKTMYFPAIWAALVLSVVFFWAAQKAEDDFHRAACKAMGMEYWGDLALPVLSPLLGAGDRRRFEHVMKASDGLTVAQYTYEVKHEGGHDEPDTWESFDFTIVLVDLGEAAMQRFPGIYLHHDGGFLGIKQDGSWAPGGLRKVELESIAFNERYNLAAVANQDEQCLRQLFAPSFVVWLTEHPLNPGFELRAGTLVVYVCDPLADLGHLIWLVEATRDIAMRVQAELTEAASLGSSPPAPAASAPRE